MATETFKLFWSPSNQEHNVGVGGYNEESEMHALAAIGAKLLRHMRGAPFTVRVSRPEWGLDRVIKESNGWGADLHLCTHSNAGQVGTVAYYHDGSVAGRRLADDLQRRIAPLSPGKDLGLRDDFTLYPTAGLAELRETKAVAALVEVGAHTDPTEARWIKAERAVIGFACVAAVCDYEGLHYDLPRGPRG